MPQVVIVSNRLPVSVSKEDTQLKFSASVGGLATGISSFASKTRSQWIGWPGIVSDELTDSDKQTIVNELAKQNCVPVFMSQRQLDGFYNGYSNSVLWPLCHYLPIAKVIPKQWWKTYREVNKLFADTIHSLVNPKSTVWVHDYQLFLLPEILRDNDHQGQIGFFLHVPFPTYEKSLQIKEIKQLLNGMLGADLVGFHTKSYGDNFLDTCQRLEIGIPGEKQLILPDRTVQVTDFPLGIDYKKYAEAGKLKAVKKAVKRYRKRYGKKRRIIVAVDRLEPAKGLEERLKAYREFLEITPRLQGKIILVMVAAPSRMQIKAYQSLKKRLEKLVSEINSQYGSLDWQPVDLINQPLPFEEVSALYRIADVAFIAPLRDGMNLVAKEYVASKRRRGVLILSETAGAAEELRDALIVNPLRSSALVAALGQALSMPKRELRHRLKNMQQQLSQNNNPSSWARTFITTLNRPIPGTPVVVRTLKGKAYRQLLNNFRASRRRLLLLDYDGSLVPFSTDFKDAQPPASLLKLITKLSVNPLNEVVLVSGRSSEDLGKWLGKLQIDIIAEHGAMLKKAGKSSWQSYKDSGAVWQVMLRPILEKYAALAPGARVEVKSQSLAWHYRSVKPFYAQKYAVILKQVIKPLLKKYGLQALQGNKVIEIKDPSINKYDAVKPYLENSPEFILAIGDDKTDEDLFAGLPASAYTVKVRRGRTLARYRLSGPSDVLALLSELAK